MKSRFKSGGFAGLLASADDNLETIMDEASGIPSFFTCERGVNRGMRPQVLLNRDSDVEQYGWRIAPRFFTVSRCPDLSGQCSG